MIPVHWILTRRAFVSLFVLAKQIQTKNHLPAGKLYIPTTACFVFAEKNLPWRFDMSVQDVHIQVQVRPTPRVTPMETASRLQGNFSTAWVISLALVPTEKYFLEFLLVHVFWFQCTYTTDLCKLRKVDLCTFALFDGVFPFLDWVLEQRCLQLSCQAVAGWQNEMYMQLLFCDCLCSSTLHAIRREKEKTAFQVNKRTVSLRW